MSLAVVQHQKNESTAVAATVAVTITASGLGNLIVVGAVRALNGDVVTGVTDNASGGSNTYVQATSARGTLAGGSGIMVDVWYCLSAANAGATTVTVAFTTNSGSYKAAFVWEVSGFVSVAFDLASNVTNGTGVAFVQSGASITTTSAIGFAVGVDAPNNSVVRNPREGNEFTSGGDIQVSGPAGCSLLSGAATAHQPVWVGGTTGDSFCSSTAAFKETAAAFGMIDDDTGVSFRPMFVDQTVTVFQ